MNLINVVTRHLKRVCCTGGRFVLFRCMFIRTMANCPLHEGVRYWGSPLGEAPLYYLIYIGTITLATCHVDKGSVAPVRNINLQCYWEDKEALSDTSKKLNEICSSFYQKMPNREGLELKPRDQRQFVNINGGFGRRKLLSDVHCYHLGGGRSEL